MCLQMVKHLINDRGRLIWIVDHYRMFKISVDSVASVDKVTICYIYRWQGSLWVDGGFRVSCRGLPYPTSSWLSLNSSPQRYAALSSV
jgi:hypothetical protein